MSQQRVEAYEDALRTIAAATITARRQTTRMGTLYPGAGEALLVDVEHALSSLVVLGAVPTPRRPIGPPS